MKYYLDNKETEEDDIPYNAIEVTTYGDLYNNEKRFISNEIKLREVPVNVVNGFNHKSFEQYIQNLTIIKGG